MASVAAKQRFLFFLGGFLLTLGCVAVLLQVQFAGMRSDAPAWMRVGELTATWLPWVACVLVLVLRVARGPGVRVFSFWAGCALVPLVFIAGMVLGPAVLDFTRRRAFDAEAWRAAHHDLSEPPVRRALVDDLVDSRLLHGLRRDEVLELLGPPADPGFPFGARSADLHWEVGPERGWMSVDSEWLFVTFGDDGRVDRSWLYVD